MTKNIAIKAVFVDLDGTLLRGVDTVTPRTIKAFEKIREKGITPIIATGRLAYEADFASKAIGADGYFIAMNGLNVYEDYRSGKLLYEAYMEEQTVFQIIDLLLKEDIFFQAYGGNRAHCQQDRSELIYQCGMDKAHADFFAASQKNVPDLKEYILEKSLHINKFFISIEDIEKIETIREKLAVFENVLTLSAGTHYIEVLPAGADKKCAVRMVRHAMGLEKSEIMVIGDSENDIGMFDEAHTLVAMGNACLSLKAKANYIAPSNEEDGVAWAIETLLLNKPSISFEGHIEAIRKTEIEDSLAHSTRQYLAGDLKLPQQLGFLFDKNVEIGINKYEHYRWEQPHYHTITSEYCYILSGETKYIDLSEGKEYCFTEGDFYILRCDTPYIQKCKPGCRLLFAKVPGMNDKVAIEMTKEMEKWCSAWEETWQEAAYILRGTGYKQEER